MAARKASEATWEKFADEKVPTLQPNPEMRKLLLWAGGSALVAAIAATTAKTAVGAMHTDENDAG